MKTLSEKLNFSFSNNLENSIEINFRKDVNIYGTLCKYCADNSINLSEVSEEDFDGAVETIKNYKNGAGDSIYEQDSFFFSIDND